MPHNLTKTYPDFLEIIHLSEVNRIVSLRRIFDRDITFNENFKYRTKQIRPVKKDGDASLGTVFNHLTKKEIEESDENGKKIKKRVFEMDRSKRLHWVKPHIDNAIGDEIRVFSFKDRDRKRRKDIIRTYIYNKTHRYVIVLQPQNSDLDYYLITAYYLNEKQGQKQMEKKWKRKLDEVY